MVKVKERLQGLVRVSSVFKVSEEIAKKNGLKNRVGEDTQSGGYATYKAGTVEELETILKYTSQDLVSNLGKGVGKGKYLDVVSLDETDVVGLSVEDEDISVQSDLVINFFNEENIGYKIRLKTAYTEISEGKANRLRVAVYHSEEFKTVSMNGEEYQRPKDRMVTKAAEHKVEVELDTGDIISLRGNYLTELRELVNGGNKLNKLTTTVYSIESKLKFVQELTSEGNEAWYEEWDNEDEVKEFRNLGIQIGRILYDRGKGVRIRLDDEKNIYIEAYNGTELEDMEVVAVWEVPKGEEFDETEVWKVYDEEVRKQDGK